MRSVHKRKLYSAILRLSIHLFNFTFISKYIHTHTHIHIHNRLAHVYMSRIYFYGIIFHRYLYQDQSTVFFVSYSFFFLIARNRIPLIYLKSHFARDIHQMPDVSDHYRSFYRVRRKRDIYNALFLKLARKLLLLKHR